MTMNLKITEQKRTGFFADCSRQEFDRRIRRLREEPRPFLLCDLQVHCHAPLAR